MVLAVSPELGALELGQKAAANSLSIILASGETLDISGSTVTLDGELSLADDSPLNVTNSSTLLYKRQTAARTNIVRTINTAVDADGTGYITLIPAPLSTQRIAIDFLAVDLYGGSDAALSVGLDATDLRRTLSNGRYTLEFIPPIAHRMAGGAALPIRANTADRFLSVYCQYYLEDLATGEPV